MDNFRLAESPHSFASVFPSLGLPPPKERVDVVIKSGNHIVRLDWLDAEGWHLASRSSSCPVCSVRVVFPLVRSQVRKFLIPSSVVLVPRQQVFLLQGFLPLEGEWRVLARPTS
jgi:hypothetical protein